MGISNIKLYQIAFPNEQRLPKILHFNALHGRVGGKNDEKIKIIRIHMYKSVCNPGNIQIDTA